MKSVAPLDSSFMAISIIGFFISIFFVLPLSISWGTTFILFFGIMFIASMVSMSYADTKVEHIDALAIEKLKKMKKK